jgi:general stress protein 26
MSFSNTDTGSKPADPYTAKNKDESSLKEKVEDLIHFAEKQKFCLLTTITPEGQVATRCMAVAGKVSLTNGISRMLCRTSQPWFGTLELMGKPLLQENNGIDFIFHTNTESGKTDDLDANPQVNLGFLASSGEWASISGKATVVTDRAEVKKHYSEHLKVWLGDLGDGKHDGGPEDPRIGLIKVHSNTIQYATSRRSAIGSAVELAKSYVTGETAQVNKLRHLSEQEIQQCEFRRHTILFPYRRDIIEHD